MSEDPVWEAVYRIGEPPGPQYRFSALMQCQQCGMAAPEQQELVVTYGEPFALCPHLTLLHTEGVAYWQKPADQSETGITLEWNFSHMSD